MMDSTFDGNNKKSKGSKKVVIKFQSESSPEPELIDTSKRSRKRLKANPVFEPSINPPKSKRKRSATMNQSVDSDTEMKTNSRGRKK